MINAFLLTRQWFDTTSGVQLVFWFASDQGPLKAIIEKQQAVFSTANNMDMSDARMISGGDAAIQMKIPPFSSQTQNTAG